MDTSNGAGGICPPYLDTSDAATAWGSPRWGGARPKITPPRATAIREKRTWLARGELATWATEAEFAADLERPLVPSARLLALLGPAAVALGERGFLVAQCLASADWRRRQRGQTGYRAPLPVLAARCELSVRHTARLVERVLAAFKSAGVGVDEAPDFVRRGAACSRRGNAYALDWPPGIATRTKNVRASGTEASVHAPGSALLSSTAATLGRGAAGEIVNSPCPDPDIDGPTTATGAVVPATRQAESATAPRKAPEGRVTDTRAALAELAAENPFAAQLLAQLGTRREPR